MSKMLFEDKLKCGTDELSNFVIFTGNHYTFESALNEILMFQPKSRLIKWLSPTSGLIYLPNTYLELLKAINSQPPIFLQHIFPVQYFYEANENLNHISKLIDLILDKYSNRITDRPFSVQATIMNSSMELNSYDINRTIADLLIAKGKTLNVKNPYHIVSIYIHHSDIYIGLSTASQNLSKWACGVPHYSRSLNRAEHKIIECIEHFKINLEGSTALDIGAAPGGWTKALSSRGYRVWAVDPAMLAPEVEDLPNVNHIKTTAQEFLEINNIIFDVIVNDMVMDCRESANIMNIASSALSEYGYAMMTAKLPKKGYNKRLKTTVRILSPKFIIIGIRQLPSNKSEVTLLLKKR